MRSRTMKRVSAVFSLVIFIGTVLVVAHDRAAAQERIRIAWAGESPANSPIWVVQDKGLLKKNGLIGEVIRITNSPTAVQALLAGELDVIVTSVTTLVASRLAGADVVMILGMVPTFVDHIISLESITRIEQLKGKTGGSQPAGKHFRSRAATRVETPGSRFPVLDP